MDFFRLRKSPTYQHAPTRLASAHLVWFAVIGNAVQAAAKFAIALTSGSPAIFATAVHSSVDTMNQLLLIRGQHARLRPADSNFQYGYEKEAFFWSLISAVGLFWCGGILTIWNGLCHLFQEQEEHLSTSPALWAVLVLSTLLDGAVFAASLRVLSQTRSAGQTMWQTFRTVRDPFMRAVLLEDGIALLSVLIASIGVLATKATDIQCIDALCSIGIGALLLGAASTLIKFNKKFLIGGSVPSYYVPRIVKIVEGVAGVKKVADLQTMWIGVDKFQLCISVDFSNSTISEKLRKFYSPLFALLADPLLVNAGATTVKNSSEGVSTASPTSTSSSTATGPGAVAVTDSAEGSLADSAASSTTPEDDLQFQIYCAYVEDVLRSVEEIVDEITTSVQNEFPGCAYVEVTPASSAQELRLRKELDRLPPSYAAAVFTAQRNRDEGGRLGGAKSQDL